MIKLLRNFAIALGAAIVALFAGAGLQELFVRLVPASRTILLGSVDIGSWLGFATVFFAFALASIFQIRWLRSEVARLWVLLGPLLFLAVILPGLDVSGCLRSWSTLPHNYQVICGMTTAMLLSPLLGALTGLAALRLWQQFTARGEGAV